MQWLGLHYLWFKYRYVSLSENGRMRLRITIEMHLSGLVGSGDASGYAESPDNSIFL
jgi:hypothetical protein